MAISKVVYKSSASAQGVTWIDATPSTAAAADIISPKTAMLADGVVTQGTGSGGITPTGNINITQAGQTDVTNYATATVPTATVSLIDVSGEVIPSYEFDPTTGELFIWATIPGNYYTPITQAGWANTSTQIATLDTSTTDELLQLPTQSATTITPSTSAQTAVAAGKWTTGAVTVAAMPTGTEGTPTATKGTVSNHSVTVTPSVTNSAGYISGGTKTGTAVTVTAAELESGTKSITSNGTNIDVTGYAAVDVAVPTGSSKNVQVVQSTSRTTSTTLAQVSGSITVSKTGTYDIYWSACRTNTSSSYTWGTRMYIGNTAYGTENTTWSNNTQNNHLTNVSLTANQVLSVYARGRGGNYYAMVPTLLISES